MIPVYESNRGGLIGESALYRPHFNPKLFRHERNCVFDLSSLIACSAPLSSGW
jgi:hypothetical protein